MLNQLARLHLDMDQPQDAVDFGLQARELHDRTGDRDSAAAVLCTLAEARLGLGAHAEAAADAMEAARTYAEMGNVSGQTTALSVLAESHAAAGEEDQVRETWAQVAELLDGIDDARASKARERAVAQPVGACASRDRTARDPAACHPNRLPYRGLSSRDRDYGTIPVISNHSAKYLPAVASATVHIARVNLLSCVTRDPGNDWYSQDRPGSV